jgi:ribose-phosphate pyrophosphokinase
MNFEIIALPESIAFAQAIARFFNKEVIVPEIEQFADGEMEVMLPADMLKHKNVLVVHASARQPSDAIIDFALAVHAARISGAQSIIGVVPYLWYARQHKSAIPGKPGAWQTIVRMLEATDIEQVVTVELHNPACVQAFSIPVYDVIVNQAIADHIKKHIPEYKQCCIIAPDQGALTRVRAVADILDVSVLVFEKERYEVDKTKIVQTHGSCSQTTGIVIDDIIATGGTAINAANKLYEMGIEQVYGYFVHPVLPHGAQTRIEESIFKKVFVSNTIPRPDLRGKIEVFDVSVIVGKIIQTQLMERN